MTLVINSTSRNFVHESTGSTEKHEAWEPAINIKPRVRSSNLAHLQFTSGTGSFEALFGPILFGGLIGQADQPVWVSSVAPASLSQVAIYYCFCGPDPCGTAISKLCNTVTAAVDRLLVDNSAIPPAHCTVRARTASISCFLAMHFSRAAAALSGPHLSPLRMDGVLDGQPVKILCQEQVFYASLDCLVDSSPVFEACFDSGSFVESQTREYDMSAFSPDAVKQFLMLSIGWAPDCADFAVELAEISHQYQVAKLVVMCEIHLLRELMYRDQIDRLAAIAAVAMKLNLQLLLAAYEVLLHERLYAWMFTWSKEHSDAWFALVKGLPDFEERRLKARAAVKFLEISADFEVTLKEPDVVTPVVPGKISE